MKRATLLLASLLALSAPVLAQESEDHIWNHLYMPLEMGISCSTQPGLDPGYYVSTSLEYRFGLTKGWFITGEYDEHSHSYEQASIEAVNTIQGDAQYTDWLIGPGYRQPLFKKITGTVLVQVGPTVSTLKHVTDATGNRYQLTDDRKWVPSAKLRVGLEYVFNPTLNLFIQGAFTQHLQPTQVDRNGAKGVFTLSAGVDFSLF